MIVNQETALLNSCYARSVVFIRPQINFTNCLKKTSFQFKEFQVETHLTCVSQSGTILKHFLTSEKYKPFILQEDQPLGCVQ